MYSGKISRLKSNWKHVRDSRIVRETWQEFKSRVVKTLHNTPADYVDTIMSNIAKRINAVLQRDEYRTEY